MRGLFEICNIQTVTCASQTLLATPIVLLGGGDTGMSHCILDGDQVLPVIEHRGGERSPEIMRCALRYPGLVLSHLQDMVHSLVSQSFMGQGIETTDAGEQRSGSLAPDLIDPQLEALPASRRHEGQPLFISLTDHP